MRTVCLTLWGSYEPATPGASVRTGERTRQHFAERGVEAQYFYGINAPKLGINTTLYYEVDNPGSKFSMGAKPTGCWLSHRALWAALMLLPDEHFFVIEDDAIFPVGWKPRFEKAVEDAKAGDFDLLYIGSCCTGGRVGGNAFKGQVYRGGALCTHGYVVAKKALPTLIATQDEARCYAPIDISLQFHSFSKLKVFTLLPRLLEQFETNIQP
jgi:GR25 family glycosyltransferase involved in LPS biosynthesis